MEEITLGYTRDSAAPEPLASPAAPSSPRQEAAVKTLGRKNKNQDRPEKEQPEVERDLLHECSLGDGILENMGSEGKDHTEVYVTYTQ